MTTPSLLALARALVTALETSGFDYALGGALALAYWAEPRATMDIDVTVFADQGSLPEALALLVRAGLEPPPPTAIDDAVREGLVVMHAGTIRVDVFVPSEPFDFYESARRRRQRVRLGELDTWVWSAEDLAVFKLLFDRAKDHEDIRRMVSHLSERFDVGYVRAWLERLVGPADPRLTTLTRLVER